MVSTKIRDAVLNVFFCLLILTATGTACGQAGGSQVVRAAPSAGWNTPALAIQLQPDAEENQIGEPLPHGEKDDTASLASYPRFGLGAAVSFSNRDITAISQAFTAVEDGYRQQGYSISRHDPDFDVGPVFYPSISIRFTRHLSTLIEAGTSFLYDVDFKSLTGSLIFHMPNINEGPVGLVAGAGCGQYYFRVTREYNDFLYSTGVPGYEYYLDTITAEGSVLGLFASVGFDITKAKGNGVTFSVDYIHTPDMAVTANNREVSVDLSCISFGARVLFYY